MNVSGTSSLSLTYRTDYNSSSGKKNYKKEKFITCKEKASTEQENLRLAYFDQMAKAILQKAVYEDRLPRFDPHSKPASGQQEASNSATQGDICLNAINGIKSASEYEDSKSGREKTLVASKGLQTDRKGQLKCNQLSIALAIYEANTSNSRSLKEQPNDMLTSVRVNSYFEQNASGYESEKDSTGTKADRVKAQLDDAIRAYINLNLSNALRKKASHLTKDEGRLPGLVENAQQEIKGVLERLLNKDQGLCRQLNGQKDAQSGTFHKKKLENDQDAPNFPEKPKKPSLFNRQLNRRRERVLKRIEEQKHEPFNSLEAIKKSRADQSASKL